MAKGRPPLNPRIEALEKQVRELTDPLAEGANMLRINELEKQCNTLLNILKGLSDRTDALTNVAARLEARIFQIESKFTSEPIYKPLFDHWPGYGPRR